MAIEEDRERPRAIGGLSRQEEGEEFDLSLSSKEEEEAVGRSLCVRQHEEEKAHRMTRR
jgi:hypothetical protein